MRRPPPFALALTLSLLTPLHAEAQASRFLTGIGYGVVGMAAGVAATSGATCDTSSFVCIPGEVIFGALIGGGLGTVLGARTASSANRAVAQGRPVGAGRVGVIAVGTVLGGATLGALASSLLINGEGAGTPLGSDEHTVRVFMLAGATLGVLQLRGSWDSLTGRVEVTPVVTLDRRVGMVTRVRL